MYIVKIINGSITTEIHGVKEKLKSGNVVKGINTIDSFSFTILPSNVGFSKIYDLKTLVTVYNTNRERYEFCGRVLYSHPSMESDGLITKEVTCESHFGFLCDSKQRYVEEQNWTVSGLLEHIINTHNEKMADEPEKQFAIGEITAEDANDNLYVGIQRENTWDTLQEKLIDKIGGELRLRTVDGVTYIDYLSKIGRTTSTSIELSKNMISMSTEDDATAYITRLIPLGCKLTTTEIVTDEDGNETTQEVETEERLDITSVNDGIEYIEDEDARKVFGIREEYVIFDEVTQADNLLAKGKEYLEENNRVKVKYSVTALDLSLIGLDIDDFEVCNYHPIKNHLLGVDDYARIIKKNINVCEEVNSTIELGDNFKTLSDIQIDQENQLKNLNNTIQSVTGDYATNKKLYSETNELRSLIKQTAENILLTVQNSYLLKTDNEELMEEIESELSVLSNQISLNFEKTTTQITNVDGVLQSTTSSLSKHFDFSLENGLIIRTGEANEMQLVLNNDKISFQKNGVEFGWWDGTDFHTGNIVVDVTERAQFGNFAFVPRSDGSLSFLKVTE